MGVISKSDLRDALGTLRERVPSMFCSLNVAQYRALANMYRPCARTGERPVLNIVSFGNGCGKSHLLVLDMIGWCLGPDYLNAREYPPEAIEFYRSLAPLRDKGRLSMRLVLDADDFRKGGSVLALMEELFPMAQLAARDQLGTYKEIVVPHPSIAGVSNSVQVKTFRQDPLSHAGSNCHKIFVNEPMPDDIFAETVSRLRSKKGGVQGSMAMFGTLLDHAGWVQDLDEGSVTVSHTRGHMYENCYGPDVTEAMAAEVKRSIGVELERDPEGGYVTNGVLSKASVDALVDTLKRTKPTEVEARMAGAPISGGGRVYPNFKQEIHVVDNYSVNYKWPTVFVMDPHAARPSFSVWAQLSPTGRVFVFAEWPDVASFGRYERLDERRYTVAQEAEIFSRVESKYGIDGNSVVRLGDPNRLHEPNVFSGGTLLTEYKKNGLDFITQINDDLAFGHSVVAEMLFCDETRLVANPNDIAALPKLFVHKSCVNVINALKGYAMKKGRRSGSSVSESVNHRYKDAADVIRYLCVYLSQRNFALVQSSDPSNSDWARYQRGRIPKTYRKQFGKFGVAGRVRV